MSDATTNSIVQSLTDIAVKVVDSTVPLTTNKVLLYSTGSALTPINVGRVSY